MFYTVKDSMVVAHAGGFIFYLFRNGKNYTLIIAEKKDIGRIVFKCDVKEGFCTILDNTPFEQFYEVLKKHMVGKPEINRVINAN